MEAPGQGRDPQDMPAAPPHAPTDRPTDGGPSIDEVAAAIAARQHGVVTRAHLLAAGCSRRSIDRRTVSKRFRVIHQGVYGIGPIEQPAAAEMAATLACGCDSLVSHASAAGLWRVLVGVPRPDEVRVIVVGGHRQRPGVKIHRIATVMADERTVLEGIPITTPARTLYDLASEVGYRRLERAVAEAIALRIATLEEVVAMADRQWGRRGAGRLRAVVAAGRRPDRTRSPAEEGALALIRSGGLPAPLVNHRIAGHEVDFFWPDRRIAVEVDGYAFHSSPRAYALDRRRDGRLFDEGIRVLRITWQDIEHHPEKLLVRLANALAARV
jgi:very-short-patch-repair endonuclease